MKQASYFVPVYPFRRTLKMLTLFIRPETACDVSVVSLSVNTLPDTLLNKHNTCRETGVRKLFGYLDPLPSHRQRGRPLKSNLIMYDNAW